MARAAVCKLEIQKEMLKKARESLWFTVSELYLNPEVLCGFAMGTPDGGGGPMNGEPFSMVV